MVRIFLLVALAGVVVAAPADPTQAVIDPVEAANTADTTDGDAVNRERKSYLSGGTYINGGGHNSGGGYTSGVSYTPCNGGGPPHSHYGGGLPSPGWAQGPAHGHISYIPASVPMHVAPAYGYGYSGHYRASDGAQEAGDINAQAAASASATQQLMDQRSALYMAEKNQGLMQNQRAAEEAGNTNFDQSFLKSQHAADKFTFPSAQQMFYQQQQQRQQQRAVDQLQQQQAEFGKTEQMMAASSNQAFARSAYGAAPLYSSGAASPYTSGAASPYPSGAASPYPSGAGSAVGVFPGALIGGGCGNAIPLLLSCSPSLVQGHVVSHGAQGHGAGGLHTSNLELGGLHGGIGASAYSNYGAQVYRAADGASPQTAQQPQQTQTMQQSQHQPQQTHQPQQHQQNQQQQRQQNQQPQQQHQKNQQQTMQSASSTVKESVEHPSAAPANSPHTN